MSSLSKQKNSNLLLPSKLFQLNETSTIAGVAKSSHDLGASRFQLQGTGQICASVLWFSTENSKGSHDSQICTTVTSAEVKFSSAGRKRVFFSKRNQSVGDEMLLDFYSEIQLDVPQLKGFLFVKIDDDPHWNRRWCWIRGCTLFMSPINITSINSADLRIVSIFIIRPECFFTNLLSYHAVNVDTIH